MDDSAPARPQPKPVRIDLDRLILRLHDLRNALEETVLALNDYQCTLDSPGNRAAHLQMVQTLDRAKALTYSPSDHP